MDEMDKWVDGWMGGWVNMCMCGSMGGGQVNR